MWGEMAEWLKEGHVSIPQDDALIMDLCAPEYTINSKNMRVLEDKNVD